MLDSQHTNDLIARLSAIPARVAEITTGWSEEQLHATPDDGEWSAATTLAHLRASDDVLAYRAYMVLVRDNPPMPSLDERRWAEVAGYAEADFHRSLEAFRLRRPELVALLRRIGPDDWQRSGVHEENGPITLLDIITHIVEHDEEHCRQIEAIHQG